MSEFFIVVQQMIIIQYNRLLAPKIFEEIHTNISKNNINISKNDKNILTYEKIWNIIPTGSLI